MNDKLPLHSGLQRQRPVTESQAILLSSSQSHIWEQLAPKNPFSQRFWHKGPENPDGQIHAPEK